MLYMTCMHNLSYTWEGELGHLLLPQIKDMADITGKIDIAFDLKWTSPIWSIMLLACSSVWESYYFIVTVLEQMQILPWQYMGITCFIERGKFFLPLILFTVTQSCKCIIMRLIQVLLHATVLNKQGSAGDNNRTCTETQLTKYKHWAGGPVLAQGNYTLLSYYIANTVLLKWLMRPRF